MTEETVLISTTASIPTNQGGNFKQELQLLRERIRVLEELIQHLMEKLDQTQ